MDDKVNLWLLKCLVYQLKDLEFLNHIKNIQLMFAVESWNEFGPLK